MLMQEGQQTSCTTVEKRMGQQDHGGGVKAAQHLYSVVWILASWIALSRKVYRKKMLTERMKSHHRVHDEETLVETDGGLRWGR